MKVEARAESPDGGIPQDMGLSGLKQESHRQTRLIGHPGADLSLEYKCEYVGPPVNDPYNPFSHICR